MKEGMRQSRPEKQSKLKESDLRNRKLLSEFQRRLKPVLEKASVNASQE